MSYIVCDDSDGEEKEYCGKCGEMLLPLNKNSNDKACYSCEKIYPESSTKYHRKKLQPDSDDGEPIFVSMSNYNANKPKTPTPGDIEDEAFVRQGRGRSMIDVQETHYDE